MVVTALKNIKRLSFRAQIYSLFVLGILTIVIISSIATALMASQVATDHFIQRGIVVTEAMAARSQLGLLYSSQESALEVIQTARGYPGIEQIGIWDNQGLILEKYGQFSRLSIPDISVMPAKEGAELYRTTESDFLFIAPVRVHQDSYSSPFDNKDQVHSDNLYLGHISILMNKHQLTELQETIIIYNFLITLAISIFLMLALVVLTRKLTLPLLTLSESMVKVSQGEKNIYVPLTGAREVQDISNVFNQMTSVLSNRERELKAARDEALTYANVKEQFTASITHEIRTPINGIYAALQILEDMSLTEEQKEYLQLALGSSELLMSLVNDILDYSKMSANQMKIENIEFCLPKIIENTAMLQANTEAADKLDIVVTYDPQLAEKFMGDPTRIQQIANNLLSNAIKFTRKGSVTLAVTQSIFNQKDSVEIAVTDTGIGIPKKDLQKIFDAYSQQDVSISRKYGGTGLGLSICKQLADLMNGCIEVDSQQGVGTSFKVTLPLDVADLVKDPEVEKIGRLFYFIIYSDSDLDRSVMINIAERLSIPYQECFSLDEVKTSVSQFQSLSDPYRVVIASLRDVAEHVLKDIYSLCHHDKSRRAALWYLIKSRQSKQFPFATLVDQIVHKPIRLDEVKRYLKKDIHENLQITRSLETSNLPETSKAIRILLVEDNPVNQKVAKAILKKLNMDVYVANNGEEAVERYYQNSYDLILMDCQMPVMDGFITTEKIREIEQEQGRVLTPIIAITANSEEANIKKCQSSGMNDFISKPFKKNVLSEKIHRWIFH